MEILSKIARHSAGPLLAFGSIALMGGMFGGEVQVDNTSQEANSIQTDPNRINFGRLNLGEFMGGVALGSLVGLPLVLSTRRKNG